MTNEIFNDNINDILKNKKIENVPIINVNLIKRLLKDKELNKELFKQYQTNYINSVNEDDLYYLKTEDLIYRLNIFVNYIIIGKLKITDFNEIKKMILNSINDIDLVSSVDYNSNDIKEMFEDFEETYGGINI